MSREQLGQSSESKLDFPPNASRKELHLSQASTCFTYTPPHPQTPTTMAFAWKAAGITYVSHHLRAPERLPERAGWRDS